jgi:Fungal fucose-specific lectin
MSEVQVSSQEEKENFMTSKSTQKQNGWLLHTVHVLAILGSLACLPAYGQQVHQLSYNNVGWADQNLYGATMNQYSANVAAFLTTPNNQTHVYYISTGSATDVHQLFYNGTSWADSDLTALAKGPQAFGPVTGFSVGNFQYVYYISSTSPNHVHQLLYNNSNWVDSDLTALTGGKPGTIAQMVAFTTSPALHVYYRDADSSHIHQLFSDNGTSWQDTDLTISTGAPLSIYLSAGMNHGNLQYVYFVDGSNHLNQLYYNNVTWSDTDLTQLTHAIPLETGSAAAFAIAKTKKLRVYATNANNGHIMQFSSNNSGVKWTTVDLTKRTKGPLPDGASALLAFVTTPNNDAHVYYVSGSQVNELYQPTATSWKNQNLSVAGEGALVDEFSGLAGFSLQNEQFVFYVAQ